MTAPVRRQDMAHVDGNAAVGTLSIALGVDASRAVLECAGCGHDHLLEQAHVYLRCPDCGKRIELFGKSRAAEMVNALGTKLLGQLPVDPEIAKVSDQGEIEMLNRDYLADAVVILENTFKR